MLQKLKDFLEMKINGCDEMKGMHLEKWAFIQCLKEVEKLILEQAKDKTVTGKAILEINKETNKRRWHTYDFEEGEEDIFADEEELIFKINRFNTGCEVKVFE